MSDQEFWLIVENSWLRMSHLLHLRENLIRDTASGDELTAIGRCLGSVWQELKKQLKSLSREQLEEFDSILAEKLYRLDTKKHHERLGGDDEEFLEKRSFIVAIGEHYYSKALEDPTNLQLDCSAIGFSHISYYLYREKYGTFFEPEYSRESRSNSEAWK